ncbi:MAG: multi-sensor hybrid histidine kinase [Verrucomicrobiales bacterium]|nr:multi-sensor hybrid histidine kinase [Verrucomicrobiales bacterium]
MTSFQIQDTSKLWPRNQLGLRGQIMNAKIPERKDISDLLEQLEAAQADVESISNQELNKAVGAATHAMLLRQAQDTIREVEARYSSLVESSSFPIFIQCGGKFVFLNEAALADFGGVSPDDLLGRSVADFVVPGLQKIMEQQVERASKEKLQKRVEGTFYRLDRSSMDVEIAVMPISFHGKAAAQVVFRNLTHSAQADGNYVRSLAEAKSALECTRDGILVVDPQGKIVGSNQKFAEMWKLPPDVLERGIEQEALHCALVQLKDPARVLSKIEELYAQPQEESFDILQFIDGRTFERYSHPHRVDKKIIGRVWSFRDITERRRNEDALKSSELRFREVWNHSSDGMRLVNREGVVVMVNDAFCQMVGKLRHEIEGNSLATIYTEDKRSYVTNKHQRRFETREVEKHIEKQLILWNGKKVWFEVANSFVELAGDAPLLLGIFRDATLRKKIELRGAAFSKLGEQLNSATTKEKAAQIIVNVADELLGWDGCSLQLYFAEQNVVQAILNVDLVEGKRRDVPPATKTAPPFSNTRKTIEEGSFLILRQDPTEAAEESGQRFGDTSRPSASLMFVPIKDGARVIGVFTIQSYTRNAYDKEDLKTLEALADHCSGALQRVQADEERQRSEKINTALAQLVRRLSAVESQVEAGKLIVDVADEIFGWDACNIDLYFANEKAVLGVVVMDLIDGKRVSIPPIYGDDAPTKMARRVMEKGGEVILRQEPAFSGDTLPFGEGRPSLSILNVPIRHGLKTIGVLSIQSYTINAYKAEDIVTLQALADHCGGTFERLRNADRLRDSEQRFQIVSKATNDAIRDWDLVKNTLWWNDSFPKLFGYETRDIDSTLEFWSHRIHANDRERVLKGIHALIESGQVTWSDEYRFRRGDGTYAYIFDRGYLIHNALGTPVRMTGVMMDITERKRVEQRHAAFSKLGQQLSVATSPHAAAMTISEITHDLFNWDAFTMALYYAETREIHPILSFDTVKGERITMPRDGLPEKPSIRSQRVVAQGGELILKEEPLLSEDAIPFGDASNPSASIIVVPIRNKDAVVGIMSVQSYARKAYDQQDLEALQTLADHCGGTLGRIRAEEALRNSEIRFHSIWENSVDGMRLTDERGIIVAVNNAYCRLVGADRKDLEGKPFSVVYAETDYQREVLEKYKLRFQQRVIEKTLTRRLTFRNGKTVDLEDTNSFIELPGGSQLLLALFRDITQQKRLEDELRHSQKMESVGQLAGGIAHDFNNILTVIQGNASLLLMDRTLSNKVSDSIRQISHVADRAANLTRQLLTFSRKQIIQPKNLDLNDIVSNMTKLLQRVLGEDVSLQVNFIAKLPFIHADPGMIEQILMNLAVNSRDAMPRGGNLFIETSAKTMTGESLGAGCKPGKYVCLSVRDTGSGISPDVLPKIFEPFFTTKDIGKGTGLGLATVYGIVKQHDGWVDVESKIEQGTAFHIYIPAMIAPQEPTVVKPAVTKMKGGIETILLVEDEVEVRNLASLILKRLGYTVLEAASGMHAMEVWEQEKEKIQLVVTDIVMPDGMTGCELGSNLQSKNPSLKVVFCSGYSTEMVGKDSILQEGVNFLQKPYTPQKLAQIVRDCLDKKV